jgi:hypothetical protein
MRARPAELHGQLDRLHRRRNRLPFLDEVDLRYRNRVWKPEPIARAVMFCLMDVSASMDEDKKDLAKRFFTLLYLFLTRKYGEVDLIFIRHTDDAEEVDEDTFFHDTRSGGTVVYSALELADTIRAERFASGWNVYAAQASGRRRVRRRSRQGARGSCARSSCRRLAITRTSSSPLRLAGPFVDALGRIRARRRGEHEFRHAARHQAGGDLPRVPRALQEGIAVSTASAEVPR